MLLFMMPALSLVPVMCMLTCAPRATADCSDDAKAATVELDRAAHNKWTLCNCELKAGCVAKCDNTAVKGATPVQSVQKTYNEAHCTRLMEALLHETLDIRQ
jgi:hypothetical protein